MTVKIVNAILTRPASMVDGIGFYDIGYMPSKHEVAGSSPAGIAIKYPYISDALRLDYILGVDLLADKSPISFDLVCGDLRVKLSGIRNGFVTNFPPLARRALTGNCPRESPRRQGGSL